MNSWLLTSLIAAVVCAFVLVRMLRWDERFDQTLDPEYHWLYPSIDRTSSVVKLTFRLILFSAFFAVASMFVWNGVAPRFDRARVPVPLAEMPLAEVAGYTLFFKVAFAWIVVLLAIYAARCLMTSLYDVFISYKSEDVVLARRIADGLLAAGWRVWFAEYQVLLQRRERFQVAILRGIFSSRFGLALTNNLWAQSEHCDLEIRALLKALSPGEILELRVPSEELPHRHNPELAGSPFLESGDVAKILSFVQTATGLRAPAAPPIATPTSGRRYEANAGGRPCSLLVEGWTLHESGRASDGSLNGQTFRYDGAEEGKLFVNVYSGPEKTREGQRINQTIDDRQMFDALIEWAPTHVNRVEAKVRGVHLLFHTGLSQMALTYWVRERAVDGPAGRVRVGGYWARKVSIIIPNRATGETAEFVFTFAFRGAFAEYCRYALVMDAFALSVEWT